jgi:23S rRNA pseudouridine1911/1915/1917 synthase
MPMSKKYFITTEDDGVIRTDKLMAKKFPTYSRSALAKLFQLNLIKKNDDPLNPGDKIRPNTKIEYDLGPLQETPEVIHLPIIYEDKDLVVVDKPAGIISHARGRFWQEASVASFIRDKISNSTGDRAGIVHRLDRATSGVMVCAKTPEVLSFMQKQFSERKVTKTYIAVVSGKPKYKEAIIDAPIARNLKNPKKFMVSVRGKSSQTKYSTIKSDQNYSTLELKPKTGRTHQLRVHLNYIKAPIVGDELYDGKKYKRLLLHAYKIRIKMPSGKIKSFTSPIPDDFKDIYKN